MRRLEYLIRIDKDPDSDSGASVPDLPGCVATGRTVDAALRRIERAIALHLDGLRPTAAGRRDRGTVPSRPGSRQAA
jgi:predicted RNase H-like HicB family nuclease